MKKNQIMLETLVHEVLTKYPSTRDDDFILVLETYKELCPPLIKFSFDVILREHKEYCLPSFESITRARRKVQAMYPELESYKTKLKRRSLEMEYRDYYCQKEREEEIYE